MFLANGSSAVAKWTDPLAGCGNDARPIVCAPSRNGRLDHRLSLAVLTANASTAIPLVRRICFRPPALDYCNRGNAEAGRTCPPHGQQRELRPRILSGKNTIPAGTSDSM